MIALRPLYDLPIYRVTHKSETANHISPPAKDSFIWWFGNITCHFLGAIHGHDASLDTNFRPRCWRGLNQTRCNKTVSAGITSAHCLPTISEPYGDRSSSKFDPLPVLAHQPYHEPSYFAVHQIISICWRTERGKTATPFFLSTSDTSYVRTSMSFLVTTICAKTRFSRLDENGLYGYRSIRYHHPQTNHLLSPFFDDDNGFIFFQKSGSRFTR